MHLRAADVSREPFGHDAKRSRSRIICARMQPPNYKEAEQIYYCKYLNMYAARTSVATRRCVWQLSRVMIYLLQLPCDPASSLHIRRITSSTI